MVSVAVPLLVAWFAVSAHATQAARQLAGVTGMTAFQGARVIVGDGRPPIENATFIVEGNRFGRIGATGDVQIPNGAARVDLTGKTVMPAIVDTHTHLSREREALVEDLRRRAQ
jgi:imidazolonepropionase-like amidohydrolase